MSIKDQLSAFIAVINGEIDRNPEFAKQIAAALSGDKASNSISGVKTRRRGRRPPAVLDPVALYTKGELVLREQLQNLELEKLRDIVAEYGMDPGKLVMKWKSEERVIEHIVETAASRARKGNAFR